MAIGCGETTLVFGRGELKLSLVRWASEGAGGSAAQRRKQYAGDAQVFLERDFGVVAVHKPSSCNGLRCVHNGFFVMQIMQGYA